MRYDDDPYIDDNTGKLVDPWQVTRRANLERVVEYFGIEAGVDYSYEEVFERIDGDVPVERWVGVTVDETYAFLHFANTMAEAEDMLAEAVIYSEGVRPEAVVDLHNRALHIVAMVVVRVNRNPTRTI